MKNSKQEKDKKMVSKENPVVQMEPWFKSHYRAPNLSVRLTEDLDSMLNEIKQSLSVSTNSEIIRSAIKEYYVKIVSSLANGNKSVEIIDTDNKSRKNNLILTKELISSFLDEFDLSQYKDKFDEKSNIAIVLRRSTERLELTDYKMYLERAIKSVPNFGLIYNGLSGESGYSSKGLKLCLELGYNVLVAGDTTRITRNLKVFTNIADYCLKHNLDLFVGVFNNSVLIGDKYTTTLIELIFAEKTLANNNNTTFNKDWIEIAKFLNNESDSLTDKQKKKLDLFRIKLSAPNLKELKVNIFEYMKSKTKAYINHSSKNNSSAEELLNYLSS